MRQNKIERTLYAELKNIRAAIKGLQARIDYVLEDLRDYRERDSSCPEDYTRFYRGTAPAGAV